MRRGIEERGPIAAWLITSRASFREPGARRTWTVAQFLTALEAETGWAPARTTYARWESGAVRPEPDNLQRVEDFYAARGISGPDIQPKEPEPVPALATALMALARELEENRKERAAMAARLEEMDAVLKALVAPTIEGEGGRGVPAGGGR